MATKWTFVSTVLLFDGLDIVTPANAAVTTEKKTKMAVEIKACFFILGFSLRLEFWSGIGKAI